MNGNPGQTDNERLNYLEDSEERLRTNGHIQNQISDHDMLIRLDEKVDGIVEMLKNRPCPGKQCDDCITLSNHNNVEIGKLNTQVVVQWIAIGASFAFSVLLWGISGGNINGLGVAAPALFISWVIVRSLPLIMLHSRLPGNCINSPLQYMLFHHHSSLNLEQWL